MRPFFLGQNELCCRNLKKTKYILVFIPDMGNLQKKYSLFFSMYNYILPSALLLLPQQELQPQVPADNRHTTFDL